MTAVSHSTHVHMRYTYVRKSKLNNFVDEYDIIHFVGKRLFGRIAYNFLIDHHMTLWPFFYLP